MTTATKTYGDRATECREAAQSYPEGSLNRRAALTEANHWERLWDAYRDALCCGVPEEEAHDLAARTVEEEELPETVIGIPRKGMLYQVQSTGAAFTRIPSDAWQYVDSEHRSEVAACRALLRQKDEMRKACGPNSWSNHYRLVRISDGARGIVERGYDGPYVYEWIGPSDPL